jgi:uncharacterized glyoxalase superfamily protein PhnB
MFYTNIRSPVKVHSPLVSISRIVYPLTTEPWGIRRFFVRDPTGAVVRIIAHVG